MHAGKSYSLVEFLFWTKRNIILLLVVSTLPTFLFVYAGWHWLAIPWVPIAMLGTAAAFIAGFRNNATYNRLWEARQIYGGIVNTSRTWGIMVRDLINTGNAGEDEIVHRELIYRHIAWLTALRFQLREQRIWENMGTAANIEYRKRYSINEWEAKFEDEVTPFLSSGDKSFILQRKNKAAQIISLQSKQLAILAAQGKLSDYRFVQLENLLKELYDHQGKCERIKNFPYPRQFATINQFFIHLFVYMIPLGMLNEFNKLGGNMIWLTIPFSMLVSWVFTSLEKVGESTENPFEGGANDVPITALSRTIEIDLREMLGETSLPAPVVAVSNILM
jgi:putative membrane protein